MNAFEQTIAVAAVAALAAHCGCGPRPPTSVPSTEDVPDAATEVYVLATGHSFHLDSAFGYSLTDLRAYVVSLEPDLVCGEITAQDFGSDHEWMYPLERVVVEEAAREVGARYVAADWRPRALTAVTSEADAAMTADQRRRFEHAYDEYMPRFRAAFGQGLFEFFHSDEALELLRHAHNEMIGAGGEPAAGFWDTRNQMIVRHCMGAVMEGGARRVLFAFGGDHKYGIEDNLRRFHSITPAPVVRLHPQANEVVSESAVRRWQQALNALRSARDDEGQADLVEAYPIDRIEATLSRAIESQGVAQ